MVPELPEGAILEDIGVCAFCPDPTLLRRRFGLPIDPVSHGSGVAGCLLGLGR